MNTAMIKITQNTVLKTSEKLRRYIVQQYNTNLYETRPREQTKLEGETI